MLNYLSLLTCQTKCNSFHVETRDKFRIRSVVKIKIIIKHQTVSSSQVLFWIGVSDQTTTCTFLEASIVCFFYNLGRTACSSNTYHSLDASGQHSWPLNGESPFSWSGRTPLIAAEPVIKETEAAAGGFKRAHNVDTGGGVVFCLQPAP